MKQVLIKDGATKLFAGFISEVEQEDVEGHPTALIFTVQCVDFSILCDDHQVARSYEVPTQTLYDVVSDVVTRDLAGEGISVAGVATSTNTLEIVVTRPEAAMMAMMPA